MLFFSRRGAEGPVVCKPGPTHGTLSYLKPAAVWSDGFLDQR